MRPLPTLNEEMLNTSGYSYKETESAVGLHLSRLHDDDDDNPNAKSVAKLRVSSLSGISTASVAPFDRMPILLAAFPAGKVLGPCGFREPLAVSTQRMVVDQATDQIVPVDSSPYLLEFEAAIHQSEGFELLVFLTDQSDDDGEVVAFPIGRGSFVLEEPVVPTVDNHVHEFHIDPISSSDNYDPVKVLIENALMDTAQKVVFAATTMSRASYFIAATYHFGKQTGGHARVLVEWEDPTHDGAHSASKELSPDPLSSRRSDGGRSTGCGSDDEEKQEGCRHEEFLQRRVHFQAQSEGVVKDNFSNALVLVPSEEYDDFFLDDENSAQALAKAKFAATWSTPPRRGSPRNPNTRTRKSKPKLRPLIRETKKTSTHHGDTKDLFQSFLCSAVESKVLPTTTTTTTTTALQLPKDEMSWLDCCHYAKASPNSVPSFNEDSFMDHLENDGSIVSLPFTRRMISNQSTLASTIQTESSRTRKKVSSSTMNPFLCTMNSLFSCSHDPNPSTGGEYPTTGVSFMESWDTIDELFVVFTRKGSSFLYR